MSPLIMMILLLLRLSLPLSDILIRVRIICQRESDAGGRGVKTSSTVCILYVSGAVRAVQLVTVEQESL